MIFGNESISTYTRSNMSIWMLLAFQAGILNIGGFLACRTFVSHVTGFATLIGESLGKEDLFHAFGMLLVPGAFFAGCMLSGVLVDLRLKLRKKPKYHIVFGVLFALLLFVDIASFNGLFGTFGQSSESTGDYTLLALLCLICGIQNGTITLVSKSVVRTTHLTGVTTDLGIGLVRILNKKRLGNLIENEGAANWMRAGIIFFFVFGSSVGAVIFQRFGYRGFIFPTIISGLLFVATFYYQVILERRKT